MREVSDARGYGGAPTFLLVLYPLECNTSGITIDSGASRTQYGVQRLAFIGRAWDIKPQIVRTR